MVNKGLLGGVIGFLLGGLVVSSAYTFVYENAQSDTPAHNQSVTEELIKLTGDDFDKAFIKEMIVHHEGAIDMAKLTQSNAKHEEIKQLGRDIMAAQSKEIDMMQMWQSDWSYKGAPKSHNSHE